MPILVTRDKKIEPRWEKIATKFKSATVGNGMECMAWDLQPRLVISIYKNPSNATQNIFRNWISISHQNFPKTCDLSSQVH
jgi:hypothetical protein